MQTGRDGRRRKLKAAEGSGRRRKLTPAPIRNKPYVDRHGGGWGGAGRSGVSEGRWIFSGEYQQEHGMGMCWVRIRQRRREWRSARGVMVTEADFVKGEGAKGARPRKRACFAGIDKTCSQNVVFFIFFEEKIF